MMEYLSFTKDLCTQTGVTLLQAPVFRVHRKVETLQSNHKDTFFLMFLLVLCFFFYGTSCEVEILTNGQFVNFNLTPFLCITHH